MSTSLIYRPIDREQRLFFSIRTLKYFFCWLMLTQDTMVHGSILQLGEIFNVPGLAMSEIAAMMVGLLTLCEDTISKDFTVRRSYFSGPLLLIAIAFFISWVRGSYMNQKFAPVLEAHEVFELPFAFFLVSNAFRDEKDREILFKLILFAFISKSFEGVWIYFFSTDKKRLWGVVELWRDGYLLGIGVVAVMLFFQYHGERLRKMKRTVLWSIPLLGLTLIMSYRRTFVVASLCAAAAMFITLPKSMRRRHLKVVSCVLLGLVFFTIITDPLSVLARFSGIVDPQDEGSAYIRLMELPNVLQNIAHHPWFGVPVGVTWKTYYRMPVSSVYTTLGTHNAYLYWPLRAGIFGAIAFVWLFARLWKVALINYRLRKSEEDFFYGQFCIHLLIIYHVASFFGLMYGDLMSPFMGVVLVAFQLQSRHVTGRFSYKEVSFWQTVRKGQLVYKSSAIFHAAFQGPAQIELS
ncbi:MAG TPA: O-antigen ligase family protein [Candidatus Kapabacteria bacterium]|jgi:O-antigen ligase|nr:O-antigen ligase family protein [Candidatus Kapabacteria bacterium]